MEGNHALKFYLISKYFKNNEKQLQRGENAYTSGHVKKMSFIPDVQPALLQGEVTASMKKRIYKVNVEFDFVDGVVSSKCTCPRGEAICHHTAALLYYAHYNISSTDTARSWGPTVPKDKDVAEIAPTIEQLFNIGHANYNVLEKFDDTRIEEFRKRLGKTNVVGFSWLLKPEADEIINLLVPAIEDILFSKEYLDAPDRIKFLCEKCVVSPKVIEEIASATVGQHVNEGWLITRKLRLTASKFEKVLSACQRDRYPPSLYKSLMEGYDLHRVLAVQWGKDNEETALNKFRDNTQLEVISTGLWLHQSGLLGASPDGLIGDDSLLEIKCPYKFRDCTSIREAIADRKYFFYYDENGDIIINGDHAYYHQIQGQLYLTNRQRCYFFVWAPKTDETVVIEKDPEWEPNIDILLNFYLTKFIPAVFDLK